MLAHSYPKSRPREKSAAGSLVNTYDEYQTSSGFVTLGDATANVFVFAGRPDSIEVMVEDNDAILIFTDRVHAEEEEITLRAGQAHEPRVRACVVRGRNATAGLNASVQVIGRWARA